MATQAKSILPDSGTRDCFSTGAVRDADTEKGRMDLVPLDILATMYKSENNLSSDLYDSINTEVDVFSFVSNAIESYIWSGDESDLTMSFIIFSMFEFGGICDATLEVSKHFKDGALKYSDHNWRKGIPLNRYVDSAMRHLVKWYRGDQDEPHDRAVLWNLICCHWTMCNFPYENTEIMNLPWCKQFQENTSSNLPNQ